MKTCWLNTHFNTANAVQSVLKFKINTLHLKWYFSTSYIIGNTILHVLPFKRSRWRYSVMCLAIAEFLDIAQLSCGVEGTSTICRSKAGKERLLVAYFRHLYLNNFPVPFIGLLLHFPKNIRVGQPWKNNCRILNGLVNPAKGWHHTYWPLHMRGETQHSCPVMCHIEEFTMCDATESKDN